MKQPKETIQILSRMTREQRESLERRRSRMRNTDQRRQPETAVGESGSRWDPCRDEAVAAVRELELLDE